MTPPSHRPPGLDAEAHSGAAAPTAWQRLDPLTRLVISVGTVLGGDPAQRCALPTAAGIDGRDPPGSERSRAAPGPRRRIWCWRCRWPSAWSWSTSSSRSAAAWLPKWDRCASPNKASHSRWRSWYECSPWPVRWCLFYPTTRPSELVASLQLPWRLGTADLRHLQRRGHDPAPGRTGARGDGGAAGARPRHRGQLVATRTRPGRGGGTDRARRHPGDGDADAGARDAGLHPTGTADRPARGA